MSEREFLVEEIDALLHRKAQLAREAMVVAPTDPALAEQYDEWWNNASNELGRLLGRLYEIEAAESRQEMLWDSAYGRML